MSGLLDATSNYERDLTGRRGHETIRDGTSGSVNEQWHADLRLRGSAEPPLHGEHTGLEVPTELDSSTPAPIKVQRTTGRPCGPARSPDEARVVPGSRAVRGRPSLTFIEQPPAAQLVRDRGSGRDVLGQAQRQQGHRHEKDGDLARDGAMHLVPHLSSRRRPVAVHLAAWCPELAAGGADLPRVWRGWGARPTCEFDGTAAWTPLVDGRRAGDSGRGVASPAH